MNILILLIGNIILFLIAILTVVASIIFNEPAIALICSLAASFVLNQIFVQFKVAKEVSQLINEFKSESNGAFFIENLSSKENKRSFLEMHLDSNLNFKELDSESQTPIKDRESFPGSSQESNNLIYVNHEPIISQHRELQVIDDFVNSLGPTKKPRVIITDLGRSNLSWSFSFDSYLDGQCTLNQLIIPNLYPKTDFFPISIDISKYRSEQISDLLNLLTSRYQKSYLFFTREEAEKIKNIWTQERIVLASDRILDTNSSPM